MAANDRQARWWWQASATAPAEQGENESYATASNGELDVMEIDEAREMDVDVFIDGECSSRTLLTSTRVYSLSKCFLLFWIVPGQHAKSEVKEPPLTLPESTHSFLFTEKMCSLPFQFGLWIAALSCGCLVLALINNLNRGSIPTNVDWSVRIAQYLSECRSEVLRFLLCTLLRLTRYD